MNATTNKGKPTTPPVKKRAAAKKRAAPRKAATKKVGADRSNSSPVNISAEERWRMVATAAYHRAEQRGFAPGHEVEDWLNAEKEIDAVLSPR
ncbi:MAG: DUF2934 domain-containing protein [Gammaproteobacteria bacterium]|nr:DUF2934 domain-containing protein [Gammaproteobacteria bacterium]MDJ0871079.1 DUF2934 domain-containing protein [Gammaproteobacteria bacterium]